MLLGQDFLLLELQKTGSSHVRKLLVEVPSLSLQMVGMHNTLDQWRRQYPGQAWPSLMAATIRNPWDWYVSLWAYGCAQKGGLYHHLASARLSALLRRPRHLILQRKKWHAVYADVRDPKLFRRWLHYLLVQYPYELPEGMGQWAGRHELGLMSYRFGLIYCHTFAERHSQLCDLSRFRSFADKARQPHIWLRKERLNEDTAHLARRLGAREDHIALIWKLNRQSTNASQRDGYRAYYDEASAELVAQRERYLIERFDYAF